MFSSLILGLCAVTLALGSPLQTVARNASFDDITVLPGSGDVQPVPANYMGLNYQGFFLNQPGGSGVVPIGLNPHSRPNFADNSLANLNAPINMTTAGTQTSFFNFAQFYFGCTANTVADAVGVVETCTVNVVGSYKGASNALLSQQFTFVPTNVGGMTPMQLARVNNAFTAQPVDRVSFQVVAASGLLVDTQLFLDNIVYYTTSS